MEADPNGLDPHVPGAKLDEGKILAGVLGDFGLALKAVAEVGTFGARKYTRGGWQHVENGIERYSDAGWRHLLEERYEERAEDSGLLHLAHRAWNVLAELELRLREARQVGDLGSDRLQAQVSCQYGHIYNPLEIPYDEMVRNGIACPTCAIKRSLVIRRETI